MILCPHCSFQNSDQATVCQGPACAKRLPKKEPVCHLHRLPDGAKVCHICAARAVDDSGPQLGSGSAGVARRKETHDLRIPQSADFAPPKTPGRRVTEDDLLRKRSPTPVAPPVRSDTTGMFSGTPLDLNSRRQTVSLHHDSGGRVEDSESNNDRIVGFLVTYTWNPSGQAFPLRAGITHIGVAPQCEVRVPEDVALSSLHASIQYRRKFLINDLDSQNGTVVNDTRIDEAYVRLKNYACIQTGRTVWTFIMIDPVRDAEPAMRF